MRFEEWERGTILMNSRHAPLANQFFSSFFPASLSVPPTFSLSSQKRLHNSIDDIPSRARQLIPSSLPKRLPQAQPRRQNHHQHSKGCTDPRWDLGHREVGCVREFDEADGGELEVTRGRERREKSANANETSERREEQRRER